MASEEPKCIVIAGDDGTVIGVGTIEISKERAREAGDESRRFVAVAPAGEQAYTAYVVYGDGRAPTRLATSLPADKVKAAR